MAAPRVLCVDPDEATREETTERLREELSDLGIVTAGTGSLADAEAALDANPAVDCLVTDYDLPDGPGWS